MKQIQTMLVTKINLFPVLTGRDNKAQGETLG